MYIYERNKLCILLIIFFWGHTNYNFILYGANNNLNIEKQDSCFVAGINSPVCHIYEKPQEDSKVIDSLDNTESFVAYPHDDSIFFYIQRIRPVEIMTDSGYIRSYQTIYGYVKQSELIAKTDEELLNLPEYIAVSSCKKGLINDADGFTNIRKERSVNSDIIGRILDKEDFWYWTLPSGNWHIVQTATGIRGFVYKDRVKESRPKFRNYKVR